MSKNKPSIEDYDLANASYEYFDHKISVKEYRRHKKLQKMIHKRVRWRDFIV